jgi:hypothetical protein
VLAAAAVTVAAVGASGAVVSAQAAHVSGHDAAGAGTPHVVPGAAPGPVTARDILGKLTLRAESHAATYQGAAFPTWIDADGDHCDTRKEVLIAESTKRVTLGPGCTILTGRWLSLYDGVTTRTASTFEVDHVVPLEEAWTSGAWAWTSARRTDFANDLDHPFTLQAVSAGSNRSKGDRDPAEWLPARNLCTYAVRWVAVKYRWSLSIDTAEQRELGRLLRGTCGQARLSLPPLGT